MNVLHLNRFFYSGQTTHVFSLVREQQKQGIDAFLLMDGNPSYQAVAMYKATMDELGAELIRPGDTAAIHRLLQGNKINLIHAHSSLMYPVAENLAEKLQIPYVVTCHGLGINKEENKPFLRNARTIISISPRVANTIREFAHKVHIIPNGVDVDEFKPGVKAEPVKIAFVARMDQMKQKGYSNFCKAADLLEDVEFYVASNQKPASNTAEYLGWTNEVATLLAQTDIVVGTGRAILEGMAAGNVAVILGRTYQGILTPEKAAKQHFLDVSGLSGSDPCYRDIFYDLAKLLQNKKHIPQLQRFSRELVAKDYNNEVHTRRIVELYKKVLG
ncbi:MAG: glycosyltransferase family 4 protein [Bacillota bacterium]|nr:glycosyltransferase family 4 protein [Bacillota bacterium]MDW7684840.1 glycosyltransferase family 4 protein [Bacillota bacterium]